MARKWKGSLKFMTFDAMEYFTKPTAKKRKRGFWIPNIYSMTVLKVQLQQLLNA